MRKQPTNSESQHARMHTHAHAWAHTHTHMDIHTHNEVTNKIRLQNNLKL